jgi:octaprenyl-diphosphate synthase
MTDKQIEAFVKSKTLEEMHSSLASDQATGKKVFLEKVASFDEMNQKLIDLYDHHLENLDKMLSADQKKLISNLKPLTEILYWRRKPKA